MGASVSGGRDPGYSAFTCVILRQPLSQPAPPIVSTEPNPPVRGVPFPSSSPLQLIPPPGQPLLSALGMPHLCTHSLHSKHASVLTSLGDWLHREAVLLRVGSDCPGPDPAQMSEWLERGGSSSQSSPQGCSLSRMKQFCTVWSENCRSLLSQPWSSPNIPSAMIQGSPQMLMPAWIWTGWWPSLRTVDLPLWRGEERSKLGAGEVPVCLWGGVHVPGRCQARKESG